MLTVIYDSDAIPITKVRVTKGTPCLVVHAKMGGACPFFARACSVLTAQKTIEFAVYKKISYCVYNVSTLRKCINILQDQAPMQGNN